MEELEEEPEEDANIDAKEDNKRNTKEDAQQDAEEEEEKSTIYHKSKSNLLYSTFSLFYFFTVSSNHHNCDQI